MPQVRHNTFVGQRIQVDGQEFVANRFENCVLIYGGGPLVMVDNVLVNVQWQFIDAAARTVYLLSSMYQNGGDAKKFVDLLLSTFGKPPTSIANTPTSGPPSAPSGGGTTVSAQIPTGAAHD